MLARLLLLASPLTAILGAALFFVATVYLLFERCSSNCTGFLEGMDRSPGLSTAGAVILLVVFALAFVGRRGRGVTAGFLVAFIATAIGSSGAGLFLWGLTPSGIPVINRSDPVAGRILALHKTGVEEPAGGRLIYRVLDCVGDRAPSTAEEIIASCADLRPSLEGYSGPERFSAADSGWRWSYQKSESGFLAVVYPDAMMISMSPRFEVDQTRRPVKRSEGRLEHYPRPR